jgi:hypothetical protein
MSLVVTTYFWSDESRRRNYVFTHEHVRILRNMVARNLSIPHRFVCVTDDEIEGIETVKLDWSKHVPGTVFIRLMQHRPDYAGIIGADRVLNLDLDMAVVGSLDHIASRPEPSVWFRNPNWPAPARAFYQSSFQLFTAGTHPELYEDFDPKETPKWVNWRFGGAEQAWISERLDWDLPFIDARDGMYGAGRIGDWNSDQTCSLPDNACLITFPGNRMCDQPDVQAKFPWLKEHYR